MTAERKPQFPLAESLKPDWNLFSYENQSSEWIDSLAQIFGSPGLVVRDREDVPHDQRARYIWTVQSEGAKEALSLSVARSLLSGDGMFRVDVGSDIHDTTYMWHITDIMTSLQRNAAIFLKQKHGLVRAGIYLSNSGLYQRLQMPQSGAMDIEQHLIPSILDDDQLTLAGG